MLVSLARVNPKNALLGFSSIKEDFLDLPISCYKMKQLGSVICVAEGAGAPSMSQS